MSHPGDYLRGPKWTGLGRWTRLSEASWEGSSLGPRLLRQ